MKAIVYDKYGLADQLYIKEINQPQIKSDELLIKVRAVSINKGDVYMLKGNPFLIRLLNGLSKPKKQVLGMDVSGLVVSVGADVKDVEVGDEVFGNAGASLLGGLAEYAKLKGNLTVKKPDHITFEEAAAIPQAATTALQALNKAGLSSGDSILIHGASGGVGLFAVKIAKAMGARVTGVCSTRCIEVVKEAGADEIIDYKTRDLKTYDGKFDKILGINGYQTLSVYKSFLKDKGVYVMVGGSSKQLFDGMLLAPFKSTKNKRLLALGDSVVSKKDLNSLLEFIHEKSLVPFIDHIYNFDQTEEAFNYVL